MFTQNSYCRDLRTSSESSNGAPRGLKPAAPGSAAAAVLSSALACILGVFAFADRALGQSADSPSIDSLDRLTSFRLLPMAQEEGGQGALEETVSWDLVGPYFLRSADPEPVGELDLKLIYGYETTSREDGEHELEFVLEWGLAENHEFILEVPVTIGNGGIDGNADISFLGFHTRFWKEDGWLPAFAMRNSLRLPTGYQSSGVDYTARGLITKSIIPGVWRLHANPFLTVASGNNVEDLRHFQWGLVLGTDYRVSDELVLIGDYQLRSSEVEGERDNHILELGADWKIADHKKLAFGTEFGLDGDDNGPNWTFHISYIISLDVPAFEG